MSETITFNELMAEISALDTRVLLKPFTDEEIKLIASARKRGVMWKTLAPWWNEKFGTTYTGPKMASKYDHQLG